MLQVQTDRLSYNWLRCESEAYPGFSALHDRFDHYWRDYSAFIKDKTGTTPQVVQWELVYVDHIDQGALWKTMSDWPSVFPGLLGDLKQSGVGEPELFGGSWAFRFRDPDARLHVQLNAVQRLDNPSVGVLRLEMVARGPMKDGLGLKASFDAGHRMVVDSFIRLTSPKAQRHWGRQS